LIGGAGSDRLWAGYGDDVDGGPGIDYLGLMLVTGPAGVIIDFTLGAASIGGGTISNVENLGSVIGTGYDDYIRMVNSAPGGFRFVNGQGGNDTLIAAAYGSNLIGDEGNDLLVAGPGVDQLSGGAGSDTFLGQASSLSGDTISDLSRGDRIIISDATLNGFTFNVVGHQLAYTGGSLTLTSYEHLSLTVSAASTGGVQIAFDGIPIVIGSGKAVSLVSAEMITVKSPVAIHEMTQAASLQGFDSQLSISDQTYPFHAPAELLFGH
jgi:Ca2+-binding RTX toxin-like protein